MPTETLRVEGLRGETDAERVRHALGEVWGIREISVNTGRGEVMFTYDDRAGSLEDFRQAIRSSGFAIGTAETAPSNG